MPQIKAYHRPASVEDVLQLVARPGINSVVVGGGTHITPHMDDRFEEVVDLQAAGLDQISFQHEKLTLGAMTRLQTLVDDARMPPLIRETARREGPNTLRQAATIGGLVVGADWESELLAALLVFEAIVTVRTLNDTRAIPLSTFLADVAANLNGGLATDVSLATSGQTASERVARTPADKPIVAVVGRRDGTDKHHLAFCGLAQTPLLLQPEQLDTITPPADFRGSSDYRRQMAILLAERVRLGINSQAQS